MATTKYGRRKMDEEAYARQKVKQKFTAPNGVVYGRRKGELEPQPQPDDQQGEQDGETAADPETGGSNPFVKAADGNGNGYVTLAELKGALEEKPELIDQAIEAEFRDGKPRKGALELFRRIEGEREDGPREEVLSLIAQFEGAAE